MWPKNDYQEQVLAYLVGVQTEIERLAHSRQQRRDLNELYTDLDIASGRLWELIEATDVDWEGFRYTLETSCDELLRAFYRVPPAGALILSVSLTMTENYEWRSQSRKPAEMLR